MKNLFSCSHYKPYLKFVFGDGARRTGKKLAAAQAIGCQSTYLSRVLNSDAHLSLEQAQRLSDFLTHTAKEQRYFLLLVQYERAGTKELKEFFRKDLQQLQTQNQEIKTRVETTKNVTAEHQQHYYSHWLYLAIHVALSVPQLKTPLALSEYLGIDIKTVHEVLDFLLQTGLAQERDGVYAIGQAHLHLEKNAKMILNHHMNWRLQALKSLDQQERATDLHYSVVYSLAREDVYQLKENFIKLIQQNLKVVDPSKEETLFCNTIDFFELKR